MKYFIKNIHKLKININCIKIRTHPSENFNKYEKVEELKNLNIEFSSDKNLEDEIYESSIVAGCESMALVVSLIAGKRVISVIPPNGRSCILPHKNIEKLMSL